MMKNIRKIVAVFAAGFLTVMQSATALAEEPIEESAAETLEREETPVVELLVAQTEKPSDEELMAALVAWLNGENPDYTGGLLIGTEEADSPEALRKQLDALLAQGVSEVGATYVEEDPTTRLPATLQELLGEGAPFPEAGAYAETAFGELLIRVRMQTERDRVYGVRPDSEAAEGEFWRYIGVNADGTLLFTADEDGQIAYNRNLTARRDASRALIYADEDGSLVYAGLDGVLLAGGLDADEARTRLAAGETLVLSLADEETLTIRRNEEPSAPWDVYVASAETDGEARTVFYADEGGALFYELSGAIRYADGRFYMAADDGADIKGAEETSQELAQETDAGGSKGGEEKADESEKPAAEAAKSTNPTESTESMESEEMPTSAENAEDQLLEKSAATEQTTPSENTEGNESESGGEPTGGKETTAAGGVQEESVTVTQEPAGSEGGKTAFHELADEREADKLCFFDVVGYPAAGEVCRFVVDGEAFVWSMTGAGAYACVRAGDAEVVFTADADGELYYAAEDFAPSTETREQALAAIAARKAAEVEMAEEEAAAGTEEETSAGLTKETAQTPAVESGEERPEGTDGAQAGEPKKEEEQTGEEKEGLDDGESSGGQMPGAEQGEPKKEKDQSGEGAADEPGEDPGQAASDGADGDADSPEKDQMDIIREQTDMTEQEQTADAQATVE